MDDRMVDRITPKDLNQFLSIFDTRFSLRSKCVRYCQLAVNLWNQLSNVLIGFIFYVRVAVWIESLKFNHWRRIVSPARMKFCTETCWLWLRCHWIKPHKIQLIFTLADFHRSENNTVYSVATKCRRDTKPHQRDWYAKWYAKCKWNFDWNPQLFQTCVSWVHSVHLSLGFLLCVICDATRYNDDTDNNNIYIENM